VDEDDPVHVHRRAIHIGQDHHRLAPSLLRRQFRHDPRTLGVPAADQQVTGHTRLSHPSGPPYQARDDRGGRDGDQPDADEHDDDVDDVAARGLDRGGRRLRDQGPTQPPECRRQAPHVLVPAVLEQPEEHGQDDHRREEQRERPEDPRRDPVGLEDVPGGPSLAPSLLLGHVGSVGERVWTLTDTGARSREALAAGAVGQLACYPSLSIEYLPLNIEYFLHNLIFNIQ